MKKMIFIYVDGNATTTLVIDNDTPDSVIWDNILKLKEVKSALKGKKVIYYTVRNKNFELTTE